MYGALKALEHNSVIKSPAATATERAVHSFWELLAQIIGVLLIGEFVHRELQKILFRSPVR